MNRAFQWLIERMLFWRVVTLLVSAVAYAVSLLCPVIAAEETGAGNAIGKNAKDLFAIQINRPEQIINNGFAYSIELHRGSEKPITCQANHEFLSGDGIKLLIRSNFRGYVYVVLAQGSTGKQVLLFPAAHGTGETLIASGKGLTRGSDDNIVTPGRQYTVPERGLIRFDENPGVERVLIVLSRQKIDLPKVLRSGTQTIINSSVESNLAAAGIAILHENQNAPTDANYVVESDPARLVFLELALKHAAKDGAVARSAAPRAPANAASGTTVGTTRSAEPAQATVSSLPAALSSPASAVPAAAPTALSPSGASPLVSSSAAGEAANTPALLAGTGRPITDKWAVILALSKYKSGSMNLKAPKKDAEQFADFLISDAGFAPSHVVRIYDQEATKEQILSTLEDVGRKVRPDDLFVFYANCHGSSNTETPGNFLLLYDYRGESSMERQLLMQDLSRLLKSKIPSERIVVIVQSCHSGFVKAGAVLSAQSVSSDLMGMGRIIATACAGDESSWVYRSGGIFTQHLVPNLRKYPKLKEALERTRADVIAETDAEKESHQMHPVIKYDLWMGDDAVLMAKPTDPRP
jgi:hypothetical protein